MNSCDFAIASNRHVYFGDSLRWLLPPTMIMPWTLLAGYYTWRRPRQNTLAERDSKLTRKYLGAMSSIVSASWQELVQYGYKLCFSATFRELFNREPRIPGGKTRVRWKCVSFYFKFHGQMVVLVYMLQSTCTSITVLQYVCVVGWWMIDFIL